MKQSNSVLVNRHRNVTFRAFSSLLTRCFQQASSSCDGVTMCNCTVSVKGLRTSKSKNSHSRLI